MTICCINLVVDSSQFSTPIIIESNTLGTNTLSAISREQYN
jgi:hypothetical protein